MAEAWVPRVAFNANGFLCSYCCNLTFQARACITWDEDGGHVEELVPGEVQLHFEAAVVAAPLVLLQGK